ncbi:MAG: glycoside hydrolase family 78 protein [Prevotella sp.]|jgi:alpha-L-rhamnosidase|nr:glycoside hydrolase family 78 protein [Prevotella sp.]
MKLNISVFVMVACLLGGCSYRLAIDEMRCEYLVNPVGIDVEKPRFSWVITATERGIRQQAYRIIVSDNQGNVYNKQGDCWDSGWTESDNTILVAYEGQPLAANQAYFWRTASLVDGQEVWSKPAVFHTGLLRQDDWKAQWLSTSDTILYESPLFRKTFTIDKKVKEARVYATAAGLYELYLNGRKVGGDVLHPAVSDYRRTVLYSVYDVTTLLQAGGNAFGVMLGNGAYNMRAAEGRYGWFGIPLGNPCFSVQLNVAYQDGSKAIITTGDGWKYTSGPVTFNHIYAGEDYDARKEIGGWAENGCDDAGWQNAVVVPGPGGKPKWQATPIQVTETLSPIAETATAEGVYIFDLGQNIAGWWRIRLKGAPGQTVRVRGAETLNNTPFPKPLEEGDRLSDKHDYHAQVWTDYTLKSDEAEVYEPHFFYTGFRYIEVVVSDGKALAELKAEGRVVRSALERNGEWTSSSELFNKIHKAGVWSQMGNTVGYPTDCPHREKGAYTGDGQVIAETSMHDFQMAPFYYKWLDDMRDSQEPNGRIPNTAPPIVGGGGGGIAWGSAYVLIPWWMNHYYNDERILGEHYPTMQKYIDYLRNVARTDAHPEDPYIIDYFDGYWYSLGEWCSPGMSDCPNHAVVNTFYYYYDTWLMSQIAAQLGRAEDARQYAALSDTIKEAFNQKFFRPETSLYGLDSAYQTYQLLPLVGGLVPETHRESVLKTITDDIRSRDNHLNTGIFGTKYLFPVLSDAGYHDLAYAVAAQETYPGYGYWIRNHCTTLLEEWDGKQSHNHQMFGAVTEYFYDYLAGIRSPASDAGTAKGYKHIHLQPAMPDSLHMAKATLHTMSGTVRSGWERQPGGQYRYEVSVPANTTATVMLPVANAHQATVTESGKTVWEKGAFVSGSPGVDNLAEENAHLRVSLKSGNYRFVVF